MKKYLLVLFLSGFLFGCESIEQGGGTGIACKAVVGGCGSFGQQCSTDRNGCQSCTCSPDRGGNPGAPGQNGP